MSVEEQLLPIVDEHWKQYRRQFRAARRAISEGTVHDLRVAARRFLALMDILQDLGPHPRVKRARRFLKSQLDQLDDVHDAQVMLAETRRRVSDLPEMAPFQAYLEQRSADLARQARKDVRASRPSDLKGRVRKIRAAAKKQAGKGSPAERLLKGVDHAYARTAGRLAVLDAQDPNTIHRVRIAFKKFRYMIETIQPLITGYPRRLLQDMHAYQDAMGRVHDTTVFLERLREFAATRSAPTPDDGPTFDPAPIEAYYAARLGEQIGTYLARKDEFHTFWRAAPDQPFPWENSHDPIHRPSRHRRTTGQQQQRAGRQPATADRPGA